MSLFSKLNNNQKMVAGTINLNINNKIIKL